MFHWNERKCRKYRIRMEDLVGAPSEAVESDQEFVAHLRQCAPCREALAAAQLSGRLFASVTEAPAVQPSEAFVTRVMASIREQEERVRASRAVWRPLEVLASRFSLVAAIVLLALSVFLREAAPALRQSDAPVTANRGAEVISDWPEPPAQPATQDEVLMTLVGADNGI
jgi:hypothetical protein